MAHYDIFIAQPFHGKTEEEILRERDRIEDALHKLFPDDELNFLSGYTSDEPVYTDETRNRIYNLGRSISLMSTADYVFFPDMDAGVLGCMIEEYVTHLYDIPTIKECPANWTDHDESESFKYIIERRVIIR